MRRFWLLSLLFLGVCLCACRESDGVAEPTNIYIAPNTPTPQATARRPELADGWTKIEPGGETRCAHDTPYAFWVRPGTVNKLLVYFQGGGGCWSAETCRASSTFYDPSVTEQDNPQYSEQGMFDLDNRENPFRDYYMVFAPSCTADIYMGTVERTYQPAAGEAFTIHHKGSLNGQAAVQWAFEQFSGPESVFVAGCSAGSIGSAMFAPYLMSEYPEARVTQLGDSLGFLFSEPTDVEGFYGASSGFAPAIASLPGIDAAAFTMADYYTAVAGYYPQYTFAQFNWNLDAVQIMFYTAGGRDAANFVPALSGAIEAIHEGAPNFRSYTAAGSNHCITPRDAFYSEEVNGVRFVDWVNDLANGVDVPTITETEE
jgi:hypothetical protein